MTTEEYLDSLLKSVSESPAPRRRLQPIQQPAPEPAPVPEPVAMPEPEPVVASEPEPAVVPEPEPAVASEPEPVAMPEPEPVVASEPEPAVAPEPEPVQEPVAEPEPIQQYIEEPQPVAYEEPAISDIPNIPESEPRHTGGIFSSAQASIQSAFMEELAAATEQLEEEPEPIYEEPEPEPVVFEEPESVVEPVPEPEPVVYEEPEPIVEPVPEPEPVVYEEPEPVIEPEPELVVFEEPQPVIEETPVVEEPYLPVYEEPVFGESSVTEETPAYEEPQPVFEEEPQPVFEEEPQPVFEEEPQPVFEEEPQPVFEEEPQPVFEEEPQPVFEEAPIIEEPTIEEPVFDDSSMFEDIPLEEEITGFDVPIELEQPEMTEISEEPVSDEPIPDEDIANLLKSIEEMGSPLDEVETTEPGEESGLEVSSESGEESGLEVSSEAGEDTGFEATPEPGEYAGSDGVTEPGAEGEYATEADLLTESKYDTAPEPMFTAGDDFAPEEGVNPATEFIPEPGEEYGFDSGMEAGAEATSALDYISQLEEAAGADYNPEAGEVPTYDTIPELEIPTFGSTEETGAADLFGMPADEEAETAEQTEAVNPEEMELSELLSGMGDNADLAEIDSLLSKNDQNEAVDEGLLNPGEDFDFSDGEMFDINGPLPDEEEDGKKKRKKRKKKEKKKGKKAAIEENVSDVAADEISEIPLVGAESVDSSETPVEENKEKKPGFFSKMMDVLTKEIGADEDEEVKPVFEETAVDIAVEGAAENEKILAEMDEEEEGAADKKAKKGKKEKKKKEKLPKVKKTKPANDFFDNDPTFSRKLPIKKVIVIFALCLSVGIIITLVTYLIPYYRDTKKAQSAYDHGEYMIAYTDLKGHTLNGKQQELYDKSTVILKVERKIESFEKYMKMNMPVQALDALLQGLKNADDYSESASELGISDTFDSYRTEIEGLVKSEFGLEVNTAYEWAHIEDPDEYSQKLYQYMNVSGSASGAAGSPVIAGEEAEFSDGSDN